MTFFIGLFFEFYVMKENEKLAFHFELYENTTIIYISRTNLRKSKKLFDIFIISDSLQ